jgi:hypothetical protein
MIRDCSRRAGGVVGDEPDLGATIMELPNACYDAWHSDRTQIDDAVEVEQHCVV